jgi:hypothetical protein
MSNNKFKSHVIFDGKKKNKSFFSKQMVFEKDNNKSTSLKEVGTIFSQFKKKMKDDNNKNTVSVMAFTPLGWRTLVSFDESIMMTEEELEEYFNNNVSTKYLDKFSECSQFMLSVNYAKTKTNKSKFKK